MFKSIRVLLGLVCMTTAVVIVGCSMFDKEDASLPTGPEFISVKETVNMYGSRGTANGYGIYPLPGVLLVNVPKTGDYVVMYCVIENGQRGCYHVIFRAPQAMLVFIGVHNDVKIDTVFALPTIITANQSIAVPMGGVMTFSYPGMNGYSHKNIAALTTVPFALPENPTDDDVDELGTSVIPLMENGTPVTSSPGTVIINIENSCPKNATGVPTC